MSDQAAALRMVVCEVNWREDFRAWMLRKGVNEKTVKAYLGGLQDFADWFLSATGFEFRPELMNSFDLVRYQQWVLDVARMRPATWNQRLAALRKFCKWAGGQVVLPVELFDDVKKAEEMDLPPDWLTDAEFGRLGSYIHSQHFDDYDSRTALRQRRAVRNRALVMLLVYCGLREFEAANLLIGDVVVGERSGRVVVRRGKGGKRREIPIGDAKARAVLRRWLDVRGAHLQEDLLFADDEGGRLSERRIQDICHEIGAKCKIDDLRPHRLRHTCAKRMVDAGISLEVVAKILGHRSVKTTMRYVEPGREDLEGATARIGLGRMAKAVR